MEVDDAPPAALETPGEPAFYSGCRCLLLPVADSSAVSHLSGSVAGSTAAAESEFSTEMEVDDVAAPKTQVSLLCLMFFQVSPAVFVLCLMDSCASATPGVQVCC